MNLGGGGLVCFGKKRDALFQNAVILGF